MTPTAQTRDAISFGPFSLIAGERLLTRDGVPVELGRAGARHPDRPGVAPQRGRQQEGPAGRGSGPTSPSRKAACGFTSPACARRSATDRTARGTSRHSPGGAIASSRRSRGRAVSRPADERAAASFSARQPARPIDAAWSVATTTFCKIVEPADRGALRHHRRRRRRRQDHGRDRGRASPARDLRGRRAVRRSRHARAIPTWWPPRSPRCWGCRFSRAMRRRA